MNTAKSAIEALFTQAYILGGSPCSGKSTLAARLAAQYNLPYYKVDDYEAAHTRRCQPDRHPTMFRLSQMTWNEIWSQPIPRQVQTEFAYYRERFEMILEDLRPYGSQPVILEGAAFLPGLIAAYPVQPQRVLYLVPSKAFQVHHYRQRPWIQGILKECADPEQAFDNWMMRDHLFGLEVARQARARHFQTMLVDGQQSVEALFEQVISRFQLPRLSGNSGTL